MMSKTSRAGLKFHKKQTQALELRKQGMSFNQIAETLGCAGKSGAFKLVNTALAKITVEGVVELRKVEGARLDALQEAFWADALEGDPAHRRVLS